MRTRHSRIAAALTACIALAGCIILASCNDDARDPAAGADPTTQPLIFSATVATPTTAVATPTSRANTVAGQWTDGDVVAVEMDGVVKKYIIKAGAGATATLSPADAANTHYWPGLNQPVTVRAWRYGDVMNLGDYSSYWDVKPAAWTVSATQYFTINGETGYQRSDFLYAPAKSVSYDAAAGTGLTFYHQTARVVVKIRKAGLVNDGNKESMDVSLGSGGTDKTMLMQGTFDASRINPAAGQYSGLTADGTTEKGSLTAKPMPADAATHGYARCYEALVIPQNMDGERFIRILIPGTGTYYYKPADGEADLRGGYTYTYDITVSEHGRLDVSVGKPIVGWEQEVGGSGTVCELIDLANPPVAINDNGAYLLTGSARNKTINITGGNPTVIVKDFYSEGGIHITGGTPEIRVEGTNNLIMGNEVPAIWLDGDNANVRITGDGITESELSLGMQALTAPAAIGTHGPNGASVACGNIEISNLALGAGTISYNGAGAVIGTGGGKGSRKCGNITITDAYIIAEPYSDAATIGFGSAGHNTDMTGTTYEMGDITLTNSTIESAIDWNNTYPAHIGGGATAAATYKVGVICINTDKSAADFFAKCVRFDGSAPPADEVIVGFPVGAKPKDGTEFNIYWNGKLVGTAITWGMVPSLQ